MFGSSVSREIDARAVRDVVDHDPAIGRLGDGREVLAQPVLARPVVVGADRHDPGEVIASESADGRQDLAGRVATDADEDRHATGDHAHGAIDDGLHLVVVECRALAGRSQREDAGHPGCEVVLEQSLVALEIHRAIAERRDDGQPDA